MLSTLLFLLFTSPVHSLTSCSPGQLFHHIELGMNEFLKTEIRALRRKKATHILSPKIRGGKREGWNHPKRALPPLQLQPDQPGDERAKAALLKLKGNPPSLKSCECGFYSTHPGLTVLEELQLHGGYAMAPWAHFKKKGSSVFQASGTEH